MPTPRKIAPKRNRPPAMRASHRAFLLYFLLDRSQDVHWLVHPQNALHVPVTESTLPAAQVYRDPSEGDTTFPRFLLEAVHHL
jgi:hypothetical protein